MKAWGSRYPSAFHPSMILDSWYPVPTSSTQYSVFCIEMPEQIPPFCPGRWSTVRSNYHVFSITRKSQHRPHGPVLERAGRLSGAKYQKQLSGIPRSKYSYRSAGRRECTGPTTLPLVPTE